MPQKIATEYAVVHGLKATSHQKVTMAINHRGHATENSHRVCCCASPESNIASESDHGHKSSWSCHREQFMPFISEDEPVDEDKSVPLGWGEWRVTT